MKKTYLIVALLAIVAMRSYGQEYSGKIYDSDLLSSLAGVEVTIPEEGLKTVTDSEGNYTLISENSSPKTIFFELEGYMFEERRELEPQTGLDVYLRKKLKSAASIRWDNYMISCENYNNVSIPNDPAWNVNFEETALKGDLVANSRYTRRDPSAVIQINDTYYVWYTFCLSASSTYFGTPDPDDKVFPWDYCDVWYATSTDGYTWEEQGPAVERGPAGSFDDRSVFTPEIFVHDGKYYLVYQVVKHPYIERVKNNVAMAKSKSPDGPWEKLSEPILSPTHNGIWTEGSTSRHDAVKKGDFDSHKVHDPCLVFYKDKFYLYYKGERMGEDNFCGEREIKWGVAIAENVEGPYIKSEYNPITNTGHEVSLWKQDEGIAIIQKLDGPEKGTIQYAKDGIHFEIMGQANSVPDALGIFRPATTGSDPAHGVEWGLCHVLRWDIISGGWMYLERFDLKKKALSGVNIIHDTLVMQIGTSRSVSANFTPSDATNKSADWTSSNASVAAVTDIGEITAHKTGITTITLQTRDGNYTDYCVLIVQEIAIEETTLYIEAEDFIATGSTTGNTPGGYDGVKDNGTTINFVNAGDWVEYRINATLEGVYELRYFISTPMDEAEVQFRIGSSVLAKDFVPNNGDWDNYQVLLSDSPIHLEKKEYVIRIYASGNNEWQWNMEHFELARIGPLPPYSILSVLSTDITDSEKKINFFPNPARDFVTINTPGESTIYLYNQFGAVLYTSKSKSPEKKKIPLLGFAPGLYFLRVIFQDEQQVIRFIKD